MNRKGEVGFRQRIQLDWLEQTAQLYISGQIRDEIEGSLQDLLQDQLSVGSDAKRGNREVAISILLKVWVAVPNGLESLRNEGLELLKRLPPKDHLVVHWGMVMAVYPFFQVLIETVGRLLRLQGNVAASQVQRRMREQFGQRSTVERATQRTLRCLIDWEVLKETGEKGIYQAPPSLSVHDAQLAEWLIEATLIASGSGTSTLRAVIQNPALFPFNTESLNIRGLEFHNRLEILRQGLDEDVIMLRGGVVR
ncbi:MAG TPA: hypothetical protein VIX20_15080 [Ktedonobacteraceae bacterium]